MTTTTITDLEDTARGILDTALSWAITIVVVFALVWLAATLLSTK